MASSFTIERLIAADADTVFDVLTDHRGMTAYTPLRRVELDREGSPDPNGVGAVRRLVAAGPPIVEEVTRFERPSRFSYTVLSGLPVRSQDGDVTLTSRGPDSTHLRYRIDFTPRVPGTGRVLAPVIRLVIGTLVRGVAKTAEARAR